MIDSRSPKELELIERLCVAHAVEPAGFLEDPTCDLLETGRRLNAIQAVRDAMGLRKL